ncbi:MAG: hypothetical protein GQ538_08745, partial [Xanthomonadales bacterium]|nr:hypothetical protein [Xanthomonadales bacterium]
MFSGQLLTGTLIVIALVIFHVFALFGLNIFLRQRVKSPTYTPGIVVDAMLLAFVVLIILIIHTLEASIWA